MGVIRENLPDHGDATVFATITWSVGDVKELLQGKGYTPSDENAWRVIEQATKFTDECCEACWPVLEEQIEWTEGLVYE